MTDKKVVSLEDVINAIKQANPSNPAITIENIIGSGQSANMAKLIDQLFIENGFGSVKSGVSRSLYGVNFAGTPNSLPINRDHTGFTFFTKPLMNMTTDNLRQSRTLSGLLNTDETSVHRLIRASLDAQVFNEDNRAANSSYKSPFINPNSPFIPILSNNLLSMSGWSDYDVQTYTSASGNMREEFSFADGVVRDYRTWDMSCSFRNLDGNLITMLFFYWVLYIEAVAITGECLPYPVMNLQHEIDYMTGIYRFTLDPSLTYITGFAKTIGFPVTCPIGNMFNFDSDKTYNDDSHQVSIQFRCHGAEYNDPIIVREFNRAVELMDPNFRAQSRNSYYLQIPKSLYRTFNGLCQPLIDEDSFEFQWWVPISIWEEHVPILRQRYSEINKLNRKAANIKDIGGSPQSLITALPQNVDIFMQVQELARKNASKKKSK